MFWFKSLATFGWPHVCIAECLICLKMCVSPCTINNYNGWFLKNLMNTSFQWISPQNIQWIHFATECFFLMNNLNIKKNQLYCFALYCTNFHLIPVVTMMPFHPIISIPRHGNRLRHQRHASRTIYPWVRIHCDDCRAKLGKNKDIAWSSKYEAASQDVHQQQLWQ